MMPSNRDGRDKDSRDPVVEEAFRLLMHHTQAPQDFSARVMAKSAAESPTLRDRVVRWFSPLWHPAWAPVLAVGLLFSLTLHAYQLLAPFQRVEDRPSARAVSPAAERTLPVLIEQGLQYQRVGKPEEAIAAYREALNLMAFPLNQVAWLLYQEGQVSRQAQAKAAEGLPLARLAVQLRPDDAEYLDTLAVLLCAVGEHAEALDWMEKAAVIQPQPFREKLERFRRGACQ